MFLLSFYLVHFSAFEVFSSKILSLIDFFEKKIAISLNYCFLKCRSLHNVFNKKGTFR